MKGNIKRVLQVRYVPYVFLFLIILLDFFLLTKTVFWPAQEFRTYPYLTAMGLVPYKDIIDQHFPGLFFFPINMYTLGLATPYGLRFVQLFLVFLSQVLLFKIVKQLSGSSYIALFASFLYMFLQITYEGYVLWVDSFIPPLLLASFLLIQEKKGRIVPYMFSGICIAIACFFKQTAGMVAGTLFLYFLYTKVAWKQLVSFSLGFFIPLVMLFMYASSLHALPDFIRYTITFNLFVYSKYATHTPTLTDMLFLSFVIIPALLAIGFLICQKKKDKGFLLSSYALPLMLFIVGKYDFVHMQPLLPFAAIVVTMSGFFLKKKMHVFVAMVYLLCSIGVYMVHVSKLGSYTTFLEDGRLPVLKTVSSYIKQGKSMYIYNSHTELYQLTHTLPPGNFYDNYVTYTKWGYQPTLEKRVLENLSVQKPSIILESIAQGKGLAIDTYIASHYTKVQTIGDIIILRREE